MDELYTSASCRERAATLRLLAAGTSDFESRRDLLLLAIRFDRLAQSIARQRHTAVGDELAQQPPIGVPKPDRSPID